MCGPLGSSALARLLRDCCAGELQCGMECRRHCAVQCVCWVQSKKQAGQSAQQAQGTGRAGSIAPLSGVGEGPSRCQFHRCCRCCRRCSLQQGRVRPCAAESAQPRQQAGAAAPVPVPEPVPVLPVPTPDWPPWLALLAWVPGAARRGVSWARRQATGPLGQVFLGRHLGWQRRPCCPCPPASCCRGTRSHWWWSAHGRAAVGPGCKLRGDLAPVPALAPTGPTQSGQRRYHGRSPPVSRAQTRTFALPPRPDHGIQHARAAGSLTARVGRAGAGCRFSRLEGGGPSSGCGAARSSWLAGWLAVRVREGGETGDGWGRPCQVRQAKQAASDLIVPGSCRWEEPERAGCIRLLRGLCPGRRAGSGYALGSGCITSLTIQALVGFSVQGGILWWTASSAGRPGTDLATFSWSPRQGPAVEPALTQRTSTSESHRSCTSTAASSSRSSVHTRVSAGAQLAVTPDDARARLMHARRAAAWAHRCCLGAAGWSCTCPCQRQPLRASRRHWAPCLRRSSQQFEARP